MIRPERKLCSILFARIKLFSAKDYYLAAMIFHHGSGIHDSIKAVNLSEKSHKLGYKKSLAFYAACLDRLLIKQGKKQKFGTQYRKKDARSKWKLLPVDSRTTDEERKIYNMAPLKELMRNIEKLNGK